MKSVSDMEASRDRLPKHLQRYAVEQNYERYTPEDQAVWRYIMRQLNAYLSTHAHPCYGEGLQKTGISIEKIPRIEEMDKRLREFGWGAVPVSGFIPPAAFMEFQSLGILPIASDMRTVDHLLYTPAPDIVHEAAGHAPILIDKDFAGYLKAYAEVASKAIISREDLAQYEAIRKLSDIKENPASTPGEIRQAEVDLEEVNKNLRFVSEAGLLSRMNWWTAEYGLIGDVTAPKLFGAGLLSSLGEARGCLTDKVKKIPLDVNCIEYSYDITEQQPQLFVTPDFKTLYSVLAELGAKMAFKVGGALGLKKAQEAETVNTVQLETGLQLSGQLTEYIADTNGQIEFIKFSGPSQLSFQRKQLKGHGHEYHAQGYSTPLGPIKKINKDLGKASPNELDSLGIQVGQKCELQFTSGFEVSGTVKSLTFENGKLLLVAFENCTVKKGSKTFFEPSWGVFDMAVGSKVISVYGGPADRLNFIDTDEFVASRVPAKNYSEEKTRLFSLYERIRNLREEKVSEPVQELEQLIEIYFKDFATTWLPALELLELSVKHPALKMSGQKLETHLGKMGGSQAQADCIADGLRLISTPSARVQ